MKRVVTVVVDEYRAVAAVNGGVIHDARSTEEFWGRLAGLTPARKVMVLLCPDVCEVRVLDVPPLREAELQAIVQREARRYFLSADDDSVTAIAGNAGACVRCGFLNEIYAQGGAHGFAIQLIASAYEAWASYARDGVTVVEREHVLEVIHAERGRIRELRRIPVADRALLPERFKVLPGDPMHYAALSAFTPTVRVELPGRRDARVRRERRASAFAWAAIVMLLIGSAVMENWGQSRELVQVREARARIATEARAAGEVQQSAQSGTQIALAAAELEQTRSHLATLVASAAGRMPMDAQLVAVQAERDTLSLEIVSNDAVETIEALKEMPLFSRVRVVGSIRRQERPDGSTRDQFMVSMPAGSRGGQ